MFGPAFKLINMTMNLLPYGLVFWGFYQMVWEINQASETHTFYTFVTEKTYCADQSQAYVKACNGFEWDRNIQVTDMKSAEESMNELGLAFVLFFSFLNVLWMLIYIKNSGLFTRSWGTVGYHAANVKSMRQPLYKYFGYLIAFVLFFMACFGLAKITESEDGEKPELKQSEKDQQSKILTIFFNGIFQCVLGLMALLTPVPDTIDYGDNIMNCKVKAQPWQVSRNVMEKFQDAVAAARGGDSGYLKDMTGCSKNDVDGILSDVKVIPFKQSCFTKFTNMLMCKGEEKHDMGGNSIDGL